MFSRHPKVFIFLYSTFVICYFFSATTAHKIIVSSPDIVLSVAADESYIYWSTTTLSHFSPTTYEKYSGTIQRANLDGSNAQVIATNVSPYEGIVVDSLNVYWRDVDGILKVSKNGGDITYLTHGSNYPDVGKEIVVDDDFVYWNQCGDTKSIMKVNKDGGEIIKLASGEHCAEDIALDEKYIYWLGRSDHGYKSIKRSLKIGSQVTVLKEDLGGATALVVVENYVYWSNGLDFFGDDDNSIMYMPKDGGPVATLARFQNWADHLVVNSGRLFWTIRFLGWPGYAVRSKASNGFITRTPLIHRHWQAPIVSDIAINNSHIFVVHGRGSISSISR